MQQGLTTDQCSSRCTGSGILRSGQRALRVGKYGAQGRKEGGKGGREGQTESAKAGAKSACFMKCFMVKL